MADNKNAVSHEGHRQRMKERFIQEGLSNFGGHEVLEMLLYYAIPYRNTNDLGHRLEQSFGSLSKVLEADYQDLVKIEGVTPHIATLITLCGQIARRYQRERYARGTLLYDTASIGKFLVPWFSAQKNESVVLLSMDNRHKVLNTTRIFEGSVNSTQFNLRGAVQQALRDNATVVVIAHNHPNGHAFPSQADISTTKRFAKVLKELDIRLLDHLIVSEDDFVSLASTRLTADIFKPEWARETETRKQVADTSCK
ncbi:MAG: DNA repair protein RadC [Clostridia bacterium]|nr:DNA repair protein RadC [Clostridia bacterium]